MIRVDNESFVTHVLRTFDKGFWDARFDPVFQFLVVFGGNAVPKFGGAGVHVVNRAHLKVFSVPREHGAHATDVEIRDVYAGQSLVLHDVGEQGVEAVQCPGVPRILVEEGVLDVSAVERCSEVEAVPELIRIQTFRNRRGSHGCCI